MQKNTDTNRKKKAILTKNNIYESAKQLFNEHGFEAVNVDDIVKHAGVAKGSFYVHFESKDALIAVIINDYVNQVDTDYKSYLQSLPSDMKADDLLLSLVGKIADVIANDIGSEHMKILYRVQLGKEHEMNAAMSYNRELYKIFYDVICSGFEQGVFRSQLSADEITKQLIVAYRGLTYEWCIRYPEFDLKQQAIKLFELLLTGIKI